MSALPFSDPACRTIGRELRARERLLANAILTEAKVLHRSLLLALLNAFNSREVYKRISPTSIPPSFSVESKDSIARSSPAHSTIVLLHLSKAQSTATSLTHIKHTVKIAFSTSLKHAA